MKIIIMFCLLFSATLVMTINRDDEKNSKWQMLCEKILKMKEETYSNMTIVGLIDMDYRNRKNTTKKFMEDIKKNGYEFVKYHIYKVHQEHATRSIGFESCFEGVIDHIRSVNETIESTMDKCYRENWSEQSRFAEERIYVALLKGKFLRSDSILQYKKCKNNTTQTEKLFIESQRIYEDYELKSYGTYVKNTNFTVIISLDEAELRLKKCTEGFNQKLKEIIKEITGDMMNCIVKLLAL